MTANRSHAFSGQRIGGVKTELLPCPFCQSTDLEKQGGVWRWIFCRSCQGIGPTSDTEAEAITAWNQRTSTKAVEALDWALAEIEGLTHYDEPQQRRECLARARATLAALKNEGA